MIGTTLGHYQITSQLGKGGMGEVFQAKDQVLGREVAIKVLPEEFAKDTDRVTRFQREAKLLASMNHPNIAAIYGLEESAGTNFLVLELVEGDTLADRIKAGPVPVEEALKLALQIAEALEAAHEKGVIHRDLKPANIKVTPDGKVKVLDFGLAKAYAGDQDVNLSNSPTLSDAATRQGVILGTAAYMSPEQAKGRTVDKRADIWAFGVLLFEMLTGKQLFSGETISETLAAVLMREPDFSKLPQNLHPKIVQALERCLEKEPRNRYSGISDARMDIQKALADPGGVFVQPVTMVEPRTRLRTLLPWAAAALVLGLIIAGVAVWNLRKPEPKRVMRFTYELPEGQQYQVGLGVHLAVSPDGSQFVYGTTEGLYLRSVDALDARLIAGTDKDSTQPFFSPDGQWIGYFSQSDQRLKKIAISGGAPTTLCNAQMPRRPTWSANNTIIYSQPEGIMRIPSNGGTPELLVKGEGKLILNPTVLPDGKSVMYTVFDMGSRASLKTMVQSLKSGERKELFAGDSATYLRTGHIVYAFQNNILAIPFHLAKLEATGVPVSLIEGVGRTFVLQYALSDSGTLVYVPQSVEEPLMPGRGGRGEYMSTQRTLVWVDRNGKEEPISIPPNGFQYPRLSPDGTRVALSVSSGTGSNIWIWDLVRKTLTRLTTEATSDFSPLWTPDGKRIVFFSHTGGKGNICWRAADGSGEVEILAPMSDRHVYPSSWSGDGYTMVFDDRTGAAMMMGRGAMSSQIFPASAALADIGTLTTKGARVRKPLLQSKFLEINPQISPDGRYMAYVSNESGKEEVYVCPFPDVNSGKFTISTSGGTEPRWSRNGRELFYRSSDAMMVVPVETAPAFRAGLPKELFRGTYFSQYGHNWDISADGNKFLMIKTPGVKTSTKASPRKINIVLNWTEELKQRVPIK